MKYKLRPCVHFKKKKCFNKLCGFAHGEEEIRKPEDEFKTNREYIKFL